MANHHMLWRDQSTAPSNKIQTAPKTRHSPRVRRQAKAESGHLEDKVVMDLDISRSTDHPTVESERDR